MIVEWLSAVSSREVLARLAAGSALPVVSSVPPAHIHAAAVVLWQWKHALAHEPMRNMITDDIFRFALRGFSIIVFFSIRMCNCTEFLIKRLDL